MSDSQAQTSEQPVSVADNPAEHRFEAHIAGDLAGMIVYERRPGIIAFMHTETRSRFEGHGVGSALVRTALTAARDDQLAVLPFCPFVNGYMKRHPEYVDLVPIAQRKAFDL